MAVISFYILFKNILTHCITFRVPFHY